MQPSQLIDLPGIFRRAAEVIERNGFHHGAFVAPPAVPDTRGIYHLDDERLRPVDMVGAIRIACWQKPTRSGGLNAETAIRWASEHLGGSVAPLTDGVPDYIEHLAFWGDLPKKSQGDVVARLQRLAIEAGLSGSAVAA